MESEKDAHIVDLGSIESGVIPTYGTYDSIFIFQMKGKLLPQNIDREMNIVQFPEDMKIMTVNPLVGDRSVMSLSETPFAPNELNIQTGDMNAVYVDRAVGVMYDPRSDTTFIGISRGVPFDARDVQKTKELNDAGGTFRVADIMAQRLVGEEKLMPIQDKFYVIRDGLVTDEEFDVQNPQKYINPDFPREMQIKEMTDLLLAEVKRAWELLS